MNTQPPLKAFALVILGGTIGVVGAEALIRLSASSIAEQILRCLRVITSGI